MIYPQGDNNGFHRRSEHRFWRYEEYSIGIDEIEPYWIMLERGKSFISAGIVYFEGIEGKRAWLSHAGQVIPKDGRLVVSEACYPVHRYTPIEKYYEAQAEGKTRLTWVRLKPSLWPSDTFRMNAERACLEYHLSRAGKEYPAVNLLPMAGISIIRKVLPFVKYDHWHEFIPSEALDDARVCSAEVACGWSWAEWRLGTVFFPSSLNQVFPSPQDIFDSPHTEFMGGYVKQYVRKRK